MSSIPYSSRDLAILAITIWGEARGENYDGKAAVAWTVRNRAETDLWGNKKKDWWGESIAEVCLQPYQYSCWNLSGDQSQRMKMLRHFVGGDLDRAELTPEARQDTKVQECLDVAADVLNGTTPDLTKGATHYYATWVAEPKWARGKKPSLVLPPHRFYNDVEPGYTAAIHNPASAMPLPPVEPPMSPLPPAPEVLVSQPSSAPTRKVLFGSVAGIGSGLVILPGLITLGWNYFMPNNEMSEETAVWVASTVVGAGTAIIQAVTAYRTRNAAQDK